MSRIFPLPLPDRRQVTSAFISRHPPRFVGHPDDSLLFIPNDHFLIFALSGTRDIISGDSHFQARPQSLRFHEKGRPYTLNTRQKYEEIAIAFTALPGDGAGGKELGGDGPLFLPEILTKIENPAVGQLAAQILQVASASSAPLKLKRNALLHQLLAEMAGQTQASAKGPSPKIRHVVASLEADIAGAPNLDTLAGEVGLSRRSLIRYFKRETGKTLTQFLHQRRISLAQAMLLSDPTLAVGAVAQHLGFYDSYHFGHVFKKVVGVSPGRFRRSKL